jgi:hypothetical protein
LSSTTGATGEAGTVYPSGVPKFTLVIKWFPIPQSLVFCVVFCILLFVLLSFFLLTIEYDKKLLDLVVFENKTEVCLQFTLKKCPAK